MIQIPMGTIPREHGGGGGLRTLIAVAAVIVIPIAAPALLSSLAASGVLSASVSAAASTTFGATVGSAIIGAGLGAVTAKVTGGDVRAGAIGGAISGGIGGYTSATSANAASGPGASDSAAVPGINDAGFGLTPQPGAVELPSGQYGLDPSAGGGVSGGATEAAALGENATVGERLSHAFSNAGDKIIDKVTDPDAIANAALQGGGQILARGISGPTLSKEQKHLLNLQRSELDRNKSRADAQYKTQLGAAKDYLKDADYYNPQYHGQQGANKARIDSQRGIRSQQRSAGLTNKGSLSPAALRRLQLSGARGISSGFDAGFQSATQKRTSARAAGLAALPDGTTASNAYQQGLQSIYNTKEAAEGKRDKRAKNIAGIFAGFNTKSGNTKDDEKKLAGLSV